MSCPIPMIVASQSFVGQTADISNTTLYTPTADGLFRVSVATESAPSGGGPALTVTPVLSWTDDYTSHSDQSLNQIDGGGALIGSGSGIPCYGWATWIIRATSGNAISIAAIDYSSGSSAAYSMYAVVEQIG